MQGQQCWSKFRPLERGSESRLQKWSELFCRSLPMLQGLSGTIADTRTWGAMELLQRIEKEKVPFFGPKTARLAVRWLAELVPEIHVDMKDAEVPIDFLVYRVASRLAIINPRTDKYWGPGSLAHQKIQEFARHLSPDNPSLLDEPLWMMGRRSKDGGFYFPINPACEQGCIFKDFCSKHHLEQDPSQIGYQQSGDKQTGMTVRCTLMQASRGLVDQEPIVSARHRSRGRN
jgi:hypothetical protein